MVFENLVIEGIGASDAIRSILIIVVGVILGITFKYFIKKIAKKVIYPGIRKNLPSSYKRTVSGINLSAEIIQWTIILVFLFQALAIFNIFLVDEILKGSIEFIPRVAIAVIIFIVGFLISGILSRGITNSDIIASSILVKLFNIIFISAIILSALEIVGIRLTPFLYIFISGLFAIALAFALAVGIAFGLALKPEITKIINSFKK